MFVLGKSIGDTILIEQKSGFICIQIEGENAKDIFINESGGHRWQRIPPTEVNDRIHTSTVTVAVLELQSQTSFDLPMTDLEITTTKGSGPGGQHRNKVESCVVVKHKPSGIIVRSESERSQYQNKATALQLLNAKLKSLKESQQNNQTNSIRRGQIGNGERGDKIRTYRVRDNLIIDNKTGKKYSLKLWLKGSLQIK